MTDISRSKVKRNVTSSDPQFLEYKLSSMCVLNVIAMAEIDEWNEPKHRYFTSHLIYSKLLSSINTSSIFLITVLSFTIIVMV